MVEHDKREDGKRMDGRGSRGHAKLIGSRAAGRLASLVCHGLVSSSVGVLGSSGFTSMVKPEVS